MLGCTIIHSKNFLKNYTNKNFPEKVVLTRYGPLTSLPWLVTFILIINHHKPALLTPKIGMSITKLPVFTVPFYIMFGGFECIERSFFCTYLSWNVWKAAWNHAVVICISYVESQEKEFPIYK